jgi:hypothetical protein
MAKIEETTMDVDDENYVRKNIKNTLFEYLEKKYSFKILGIPNIGKSTTIRLIHNKCLNNEFTHPFFPFTITNYSFEIFRDTINDQLSLISNAFFDSTNTIALLNFAIEQVKIKNMEPIFLFDDFSNNCRNDENTRKSILTEEVILHLRSLIDRRKTTCIFTYDQPIIHLLSTAWYLNNVEYSIDLSLLSSQEAENLVKGRRGLGISKQDFQKIISRGGRHPEILDYVALNHGKINDDSIDSWCQRQYQEILNHCDEYDKILGMECETFKNLRKVSQMNNKPDDYQCKFYCFSEKIHGTVKWYPFSDNFAEYINDNKKRGKPVKKDPPQQSSYSMQLSELKINIFISYSHENAKWVTDEVGNHKLIKFFYKSLSNVQIWFDGHLEAGDPTEKKVKEQINMSEIAIILISPEFMNSSFIKKIEMPSIVNRYASGKMEIVPILIENSNIEQFYNDFNSYYSKYSKNMPITNEINIFPKSEIDQRPIPMVNLINDEPKLHKVRYDILKDIQEKTNRLKNNNHKFVSRELDFAIR